MLIAVMAVHASAVQPLAQETYDEKAFDEQYNLAVAKLDQIDKFDKTQQEMTEAIGEDRIKLQSEEKRAMQQPVRLRGSITQMQIADSRKQISQMAAGFEETKKVWAAQRSELVAEIENHINAAASLQTQENKELRMLEWRLSNQLKLQHIQLSV
jgi:hypothetical protein